MQRNEEQMSKGTALLRSLRRDRTYVYRLIGLILFAAVNLLTVITLHLHHDGQMRFLEITNLVTGIIITTIFVIGALDLVRRSTKYEKIKNEKKDLQSKLVTSQDLLFRIDNETRQEVGAWMHGTLQPQLTRLAKDIRAKKESDCNIVAQQVDDISEKYVRAYSHELFPPALFVSLEVGLETLLDGRAELNLDHQLTNASSFGISLRAPESELGAANKPLRLILNPEKRYAIYRIVEEAVANAEKKSSTSRIVVDIRFEGEDIRVSIRDNGAPVPQNVKPGLGHSIIDAFIQKFDGSFLLANVVDGVELVALIPYTPLTAAEKLNYRFQGGGLSE
jgi:signal transduction histidine kinase